MAEPPEYYAQPTVATTMFEDISMDGYPDDTSIGERVSLTDNVSKLQPSSEPGPASISEGLSELVPDHPSGHIQSSSPLPPSPPSQHHFPPRRRPYVSPEEYVDLDAPRSDDEDEGEPKELEIEDDVQLCLEISDDIGSKSTPPEVARELSRCLHEPKYELLKDAVCVMGVEKSLEVFFKTKHIQESGGQILGDGSNRKKAPGGVFLTMIKKMASEQERKEIFKRDKKICAQKQKRLKRTQQIQRRRNIREKAQRQLELFRSQLSTSDIIAVIPGNGKDRNMHKRLYGTKPELEQRQEQQYTGNTVANIAVTRMDSNTVEAMDVDSVPRHRKDGLVTTGGPDNAISKDVMKKEQKLAEEFELLEDYNLVDCGLDLI